MHDPETLQRIKSLVIPPAWSAVWISPDPLGHLQVTGRDQRGRKQYRYHARWRAVRDEAKYGKTLTFARVLPSTRARVDADLRRHGLPRERVLAAVVRLLELSLFRIGNREYARTKPRALPGFTATGAAAPKRALSLRCFLFTGSVPPQSKRHSRRNSRRKTR